MLVLRVECIVIHALLGIKRGHVIPPQIKHESILLCMKYVDEEILL